MSLFPPDTVTWRVHADPTMALGGLRALLLQAVHPVAMAGVAAHSGFRDDPWGRLLRTAEYVGTVTFGTPEEAERAAARVRGLHRRQPRVVDEESGETFRIDDPELLLWVHCCETDSFLATYARCGGPLDAGDADRYFAEQVRSAELIGIPPAMVPADAAAMAAYFERMRPRLRVTPEARSAARFVLLPPMPRLVAVATPARPAWITLAGTAFAMLPRWTRRLYRLPVVPGSDVATTLYGRALRRGLVSLPPALREGPHVKAAKARLSA